MYRIILEGPDGGGKSTLVKSLKLPCHHQGPYKTSPYYESLNILNDTDHEPALVFDRFYHGERIYGPVFRGRTKLSPFDQKRLDEAMLTRNTVLVLCLPPWQTVLDSYLARRDDEMLTDTKQLRDVYRLYMAFPILYGSLLPYLWFDYTAHTVNQLKERIHGTLAACSRGH